MKFVRLYNPEGRWRRYTCEEIPRREGANLDLYWSRSKTLEDSADLEAALEQFAAIAPQA